jgi:Restriction Endonuclease associating with ARP
VVAGFKAVFTKLITWASQARGAVARPWVCPACGTTRTWTAAGEAAWDQRAATGSSALAPPAMISTVRGAAARMASGMLIGRGESALLPAARPVLLDLAARGLDHRWVLHVRSSQAFALNLFALLDQAGLRKVLGYLGRQVLRADPPDFEYSDDSGRLGESSLRDRHQTQVDVVLRGTGASGERVVALIEVKFTETDFSGCSAYDKAANPARDVCRSPGLFGSEPDRCFQLANHGYGRRRYADYLSGVPVNMPSGSSSDGGCLVRRGLSQPMRNLALAHLMLAEAEADRVVYARCAPDGHPTIWRRLNEVRSAFPDTDRRIIRPLAASVVASLHPDEGSAFYQHYQGPELTRVAPL